MLSFLLGIYIPRSGIAGSYSISLFQLLRSFQTLSREVDVHHQQQSSGALFSLHPHQHLLLSVFLIIATLRGVKWFLIAILICVFLMISGIEHLFLYLFILHIFYIKALYQIYGFQIFSTIPTVVFSFS